MKKERVDDTIDLQGDDAISPFMSAGTELVPACSTDVTRGTSPTNAAYWLPKIKEGWRNSVAAILVVSRDCAEAFANLDVTERNKLVARLPMDRTTFSKLSSIGKNAALHDKDIQPHLPANWTIIHKLANCTGEEISRAIRAQVLHPDCARRELDAWLKGNSEARKDDARRKASNDARHDDLLRQLTDALKPSPEFRAIWKRCPDAVRARFARSLTKSIY